MGAVNNSDSAIRDLFLLGEWNQHRGNEGAGFALHDPERGLEVYKGYGSTHDVFYRWADQASRRARTGIQHNRYSLTGLSTEENVQPIMAGNIVLAHNGNLVNFEELEGRYGRERERLGVRAASDSALLAVLYALEGGDLYAGTQRVFDECRGTFNLLLMNQDGELAAVRDEHEVNPFFMAEREGEVYIDSEDMPILALGNFKDEDWSGLVREIEGGTMALISGGEVNMYWFRDREPRKCPFQPVYFELHSSHFNGVLNSDIRMRLAERLHRRYGFRGDIVVPVLDSGVDYAVGVSRTSGIPLSTALTKDRYIGRTYTAPDGKGERTPEALKFNRREKSRMKNVAIPDLVRGKDVICADDSIVRLNVSTAAASSFFVAGAKSVSFYSGFPPIRYPCFYGMDHAKKSELAAAEFPTVEEANSGVARKIAEAARVSPGRVRVGYGTWDDIRSVVGDEICTACGTGDYFILLPGVQRVLEALQV